MLRSSTFADQMSTCNDAAACIVKNDSPFPFEGRANVRLLNVITGASTVMTEHPLSMAAGAGVADWYCATEPGSSIDSGRKEHGSAPPEFAYTRRVGQIPVDRNNYTNPQYSGEANCEKACDADKSCVGFTYTGWPTNPTSGKCWLYEAPHKVFEPHYGAPPQLLPSLMGLAICCTSTLTFSVPFASSLPASASCYQYQPLKIILTSVHLVSSRFISSHPPASASRCRHQLYHPLTSVHPSLPLTSLWTTTAPTGFRNLVRRRSQHHLNHRRRRRRHRRQNRRRRRWHARRGRMPRAGNKWGATRPARIASS